MIDEKWMPVQIANVYISQSKIKNTFSKLISPASVKHPLLQNNFGKGNIRFLLWARLTCVM